MKPGKPTVMSYSHTISTVWQPSVHSIAKCSLGVVSVVKALAQRGALSGPRAPLLCPVINSEQVQAGTVSLVVLVCVCLCVWVCVYVGMW